MRNELFSLAILNFSTIPTKHDLFIYIICLSSLSLQIEFSFINIQIFRYFLF